MKTRSLFSYFAIFFITLTLTVACTNPVIYIKITTEADAGGTADVRLGFSAWQSWFLWQVAQEEGIFKKNNKVDREKFYKIMSKRAGVDVKEYQEYADGTKLFTLEENLKAFQPGNDITSLEYAAQEMGKFLAKIGLTPTVPDTSKLFDDRFVKAYAEKAKKS